MRTAQQIFDTVVTHLRKQNAKSLNLTGCAYLANDGKQCAVGCLIPIEAYRSELECNVLARMLPRLKPHAPDLYEELWAHRVMLDALQVVHDCHAVHSWESALAKVATDHNVSYSKP